MAKRYSAAQAADFLSGYRSSGLTRQEYARRRGISVSYLDRLVRDSKEREASEGVGGFVELPRPEVLNRRHLVEIQFFDGTTIKIGG